jgi:hypothetical protein
LAFDFAQQSLCIGGPFGLSGEHDIGVGGQLSGAGGERPGAFSQRRGRHQAALPDLEPLGERVKDAAA